MNPPISGINAIALQPDGKVLLGVRQGPNLPSLIRLNADGVIDDSFNGISSTNMTIQALAVESDGKILAGGYPYPTSTNSIARFNPDGSLDTTFGPRLATTNTYGPWIYFLDPLVDGRVFIRGDFSAVNGISREQVALLNSDGTLDTRFDPAAFRLLRPGAPETTGFVSTLAGLPDGKLLVAGTFNSVSGIARTNLARLNWDGSVDMTFVSHLQEAIAGINNVSLLALQMDHKILIAGVTDLNSSGAYEVPFLARLSPEGVVDSSFAPPREISAQLNYIDFLRVQSDGKVDVAGENLPQTYHVLRLNSDGSIDRNLTAPIERSGGVLTGEPRPLSQPDGRVIGGVLLPNSRRNFFGRLLSDLTVPSVAFMSANFHVMENAGAATITLTRTGDTSDSLSVQYVTQDGTAKANADYEAQSGTVVFAPLETTQFFTIPIFDDGLVNGDRTVLATLSNPSNGAILSEAGRSAVLTIQDNELPTSDGSAHRAVQFSSPSLQIGEGQGIATLTVQRTGETGNAAEVDYATTNGSANAGLDFEAQTGTLHFAPLETAKTISIPLHDNLLVNPNKTFEVKLSNPSSGVLLGAGPSTVTIMIYDDDRPGSVDFGFAPPSLAASRRYSFGGPVSALAAQPDGKVLAGGMITLTNPATGLPTSAFRLNADGSLDTSFRLTVPIHGFDIDLSAPSISVFAPATDGTILIGGTAVDEHLVVNGEVRHGIARLNEDGTLDRSFTAEVNGGVQAISIQADGKIVIGGSFSTGITRLNPKGELDFSFNVGAGVNAAPWRVEGGSEHPPRGIQALLLQPDGKVLIAGDFTSCAESQRNGIARLNPNGSLDQSFDPKVGLASATVQNGWTPMISSMALQTDGKILIAGRFDSFDGAARGGLARLNSDGSLEQNFAKDLQLGDYYWPYSIAVEASQQGPTGPRD